MDLLDELPPEGIDGLGESEILRYRGFLRLLAEGQVEATYRKRVDASDMVQETLLKAWRDRDQFRGRTREELLSWLRTILAHTIANARRDHRRLHRDYRLERSIEASIDDSSRRVLDWLSAKGPSPSSQFVRVEFLEQVATAVEALPPLQREAVILRHWQGLPLQEIAAQMVRSPGAVAALIHRGVESLRRTIDDAP
jgi:RNA polymerase sigma-70 factor, ECF subfamily